MRDCRFVEYYVEAGKVWDGLINKLTSDGKIIICRGGMYVIPNINKYSDEAKELTDLGFRESSLMDWDFD